DRVRESVDLVLIVEEHDHTRGTAGAELDRGDHALRVRGQHVTDHLRLRVHMHTRRCGELRVHAAASLPCAPEPPEEPELPELALAAVRPAPAFGSARPVAQNCQPWYLN